MNSRVKSYQGLSEALSDQSYLISHGIAATVENSQDIHPSLIGQVFLSVPNDQVGKAIILLQNKPEMDDEDTDGQNDDIS